MKSSKIIFLSLICINYFNSSHNKKMEDDLVKQHKNKAKKNKCSEKQNLSEENIIIVNKILKKIKNLVNLTNNIFYLARYCSWY